MNLKSYLLSLCLAFLAMAVEAQHNPIFSGGAEDGAALEHFLTPTHNAIFEGGGDDGNAMAIFSHEVNNDIFMGGEDDGSDMGVFVQATNNEIFLGGQNDGYDQAVFTQATHNDIFRGGEDDGYHAIRAIHSPVSKKEKDRRRIATQLLNFEAWPQNEQVQSQWVVSGEEKQDEYVIEKSRDKSSLVEVGRIASLNAGETVHSYELTDEVPFEGKSFYRLRSIDMEGVSKFSPWVEVEFEAKAQTSFQLSAYPNPANHTLNLEITTQSNRELNIQLVDLLGHAIALPVCQLKVNGFYQTKIEMRGLAEGFYILRVLDPANGEQITRKIQKTGF